MLKLRWLAVLALLLLAACDSGFHDHGHRFWTLTIDNQTHEVFEIQLDGLFLATMADHTRLSVDLAEGHHLLQAFDNFGDLRAEREFHMDGDFVWILEP